MKRDHIKRMTRLQQARKHLQRAEQETYEACNLPAPYGKRADAVLVSLNRLLLALTKELATLATET